MSILTLASASSAYRGYEYYTANKVLLFTKTGERQYRGIVSGSGDTKYDVFVDEEHPRKSKCTCPHANGRYIICKHKVAMYFKEHPDEAEEYYESLLDDEYDEDDDCDEDDDYYEDTAYRYDGASHSMVKDDEALEAQTDAVIDCISHMSRDELQQALLQLLFDGSARQFWKFIEEHGVI